MHVKIPHTPQDSTQTCTLERSLKSVVFRDRGHQTQSKNITRLQGDDVQDRTSADEMEKGLKFKHIV